MSGFNDRNQPYRRPKARHFADRTHAASQRSLLAGSALLLGLALLMALAMIPLRTADPEATQTSRDAAQSLTADCAVIQKMTYVPCGHHITRRTALPTELVGHSRTDLEAAYDPWQVTSYGSTEVHMERQFDLFCPQHIVLLPDESGQLCAWQNKYGDALALVKPLGTAASELPDEAQSEARRGKGFDTLEALEKWLESMES